VLRLERPKLEIDRNEASQPPMKQEQVNVVVPVTGGDSELPRDKAEVTAKFKQKALEMVDKCTLKVTLVYDDAALDTEELKNIWISQLPCWGIGQRSLTGKGENRVAIITQPDALTKQTILLT
jgi:hypothetical protein